MSRSTRDHLLKEKRRLNPNNAESHIPLAEKYAREYDYEEALKLTLKAFELENAEFKRNSTPGKGFKLTETLNALTLFYTSLGDHEESLGRSALRMKILKDLGFHSELIEARIQHGDLLIEMGKLDDALNHFLGIEGETGEGSAGRASVYAQMAKVLYKQGKVGVAKKRLAMGTKILEKLRTEDAVVYNTGSNARVFYDIGGIYEKMNEFALTADSLGKALMIVEKLPKALASTQQWMLMLSSRIGESLVKCEEIAKTPLGIQYLNDGVKILKEHIKAGSKFLEKDLAVSYNSLGIAYNQMDSEEKAIEMFLKARNLTISFRGPNHQDSLFSGANLAALYAQLGRISLAIEVTREVVKGWESHGPSAQEECRKARCQLEVLEGAARIFAG